MSYEEDVHFFNVDIDKRYTPSQRKAIAKDIVDFVLERTENGRNKNNSKFPSYSASYRNSLDYRIAGKGSSGVNLRLSDEMMDSLDLVDHKAGQIKIGYDRGDGDLLGKVEGNVKGTYGDDSRKKKKPRNFMGITDKALNEILGKYKIERKVIPGRISEAEARARVREVAEREAKTFAEETFETEEFF